MRLIVTLFIAALLSVSFSSVNAQKKIIVANGDTVIVGGPTVQNTVPPIVKKTVPVKKKMQPIRKQPASTTQNLPIRTYDPIPWYYPMSVEPKNDQFSTAMIVLLSLFGLFALAGLILGIIALCRRTPLRMNNFTVHGSTVWGGNATANPDLSRDYHGDHSSREKNDFHYYPERKEEKVPGNGVAKESAN